MADGVLRVGRKPIPRPGFLDTCDYLGYIYGERRWRDANGDLIHTWDSLHGELEVFDTRGHHVGAADPVSGERIKPARQGR
jgi:hypothetical protein